LERQLGEEKDRNRRRENELMQELERQRRHKEDPYKAEMITIPRQKRLDKSQEFDKPIQIYD